MKTIAEILARPRCAKCDCYYDWHKRSGGCPCGCTLTLKEAKASAKPRDHR